MSEKWDAETIARATTIIAREAEQAGTAPEDILSGVASALSILLARIEPAAARDKMVKVFASAIPKGVKAARQHMPQPAERRTSDILH